MKSLGNFPDPFLAEIAGQPAALRRAAAGLGDQLGVLEVLTREAPGRRTVLTGMGSSHDACYPVAVDLARSGRAAAHLDSSELLHFHTGMLGPDLVVAVSQSGASAEVVTLARTLARRTPRPMLLAVTNGCDNPLAEVADLVLDTRAGPEDGPSTMTFAAALVVLAAVGRVVAGTRPEVAVGALVGDAELAATRIERLVASPETGERLAAHVEGRGMVVVLGRGSARAAAEMGALTLKETAAMQAEALETAQFRHGPLELAGPDLCAVVVATEPETLDLDLALVRELLDAGTSVVLVTGAGGDPHGAAEVAIGTVPRHLAPAVSLVPLQLLARTLAILRDREPGSYMRASKVTTHE